MKSGRKAQPFSIFAFSKAESGRHTSCACMGRGALLAVGVFHAGGGLSAVSPLTYTLHAPYSTEYDFQNNKNEILSTVDY
mgnify:CR=1 FL=1